MRNVLGIAIVLTGVVIVSLSAEQKKKENEYASLFITHVCGDLFFRNLAGAAEAERRENVYRVSIYEYLNWRVIVAYGISFSVLLLNTYAYTVVPMKYGAVIDTFTYVFVMGLSYLILKEHFTRGQLIGNLIIIAGVLVYTL